MPRSGQAATFGIVTEASDWMYGLLTDTIRAQERATLVGCR
jgi:hypothetical protein